MQSHFRKIQRGSGGKGCSDDFFVCIQGNLSNLGVFSAKQYHPDIEHLLRINHAGRVLVEGGIGKQPIPICLWPIVLERAFEKSTHVYGEDFRHNKRTNPTGLFYLIRNGPVLQYRGDELEISLE